MKGKNSGLLVGGLVLAGFAMYYSHFKDFKNSYRIRFQSATINSEETRKSVYTRLVFNLMLQVVNPTAFTGNLTGLKLKISYSGRFLSEIVLSSKLDLKANSTTSIPLMVSIPTLEIFGTIQNVVAALQNRTGIAIKVEGTAVTNVGTIFINEQIRVI